jgi:hypothetical protein
MSQVWTRYSYGWITLGFFLISLIGHWLFGWMAYVSEQAVHGAQPELAGWFVEMSRDTLENWQSEFLQLLWQVGGLAFLLFLGSPQSKEGSDRLEAKVDEIIRHLDPKGGERIIEQIDDDYSGRHTDAQHAHRPAPERKRTSRRRKS